MKKRFQLHWIIALFLLFSVAAPVSAAEASSATTSVLVAQADDAKAAPAETETTEKKDPRKTKPVLAKTKEGKYALAIVIGAVVLLFILIFIKSSKLD